jgi:hypothetical protein
MLIGKQQTVNAQIAAYGKETVGLAEARVWECYFFV